MIRECALLFGFVVLAYSGRLIQDDPSWSSKALVDKPWIEEAPDDEVARKELITSANEVITSPVITGSSVKVRTSVAPGSPPQVYRNARKLRKFTTSVPPSVGKKRRGGNNFLEISQHRLMAPLDRGNVESKVEAAGSRVMTPRSDRKPFTPELPGDDEDAALNEDPRGKRAASLWKKYPPHTLTDVKRFFTEAPLTTPIYPYGACLLSLGYKDNPKCYGGSVCVDKISGNRVDCPNGEEGCPPCGPSSDPGGPPSPPPPPNPVGGDGDDDTGAPAPSGCPKGCKRGEGCPILSEPEDGICADPKRQENEYDLSEEFSTTIRTPAVYYSGVLPKGASCNVYGDLIDEAQKSDLNFADKSKRLKSKADSSSLGGSICNWAQARLQCIPKGLRTSTTTEEGFILTESNREAAKRIEGTCQCMLALGSKATAIKDPNTEVEICYIPANKGHYSDCDHEIYPPYGVIEGVRKDGSNLLRGSEPAGKFCVPNAECRAGYKYTGLRCQCKRKTRWDPKTYECSRATRLMMWTEEALHLKERVIMKVAGTVQVLLFLINLG